ncbi:MAG: hypothetical protein MPJ83_06770 [Gammaproteobacteria bacterium]|nr:hypothetical protein [Gammaproteobacteria bacterium]
MKRAHPPVVAAQQQRAFAECVQREIIARRRQVADMAGEQPVALEDALHFKVEEFRVPVGPWRE